MDPWFMISQMNKSESTSKKDSTNDRKIGQAKSKNTRPKK